MNTHAEIQLPQADEIVAKYIEIRAFVKAEQDAFKERMRPYNSALEALEGAADLLMKQTGQKALSTEHGTAFYSHIMSVTCEDQEVFLNFVFSTNSRQFLTAHVAKEAVQAYMDGPGEGHPPPGVKVTPVINVNFRKA